MYKLFRVIEIMNIRVEIQDDSIKRFVEKYIQVYHNVVLSQNNNQQDQLIYITDSIKGYHKHNNTIIMGFELEGYVSIQNDSDGAMVIQALHTMSQRISVQNLVVHISDDIKLEIPSIISVEAYNRKTVVKTLKNNYQSKHNFKFWIEKLRYHNFVEVHRGILVNIDAIDVFKNDVAYLSNATTVPVSRRKKTMLKYLLKNTKIKTG